MALDILVALDGSAFSVAAGRVAMELARKTPGATLHALHVINVRRASGDLLKDFAGRLGFEPAIVSEDVNQARERQGRLIMDDYTRDAELAGVSVKTTVETGAVAETLIRHAAHADLVIMGLRGTTEERFPGQGGGNLDQLLAHVHCPVLFVPAEVSTVTGVALGYDGSTGAAHALKAGRLLANGFGVPIHAMFVSDDGQGGEVLDEVADHAAGATVHKHVLLSDEPHTALAREAANHGANTLALGFRGHSPMKDFFYGSACEYILVNTDLLVLVAH